jgi:hypothetical protein
MHATIEELLVTVFSIWSDMKLDSESSRNKSGRFGVGLELSE